MKQSPENQVIESAIIEIQALADNLDSTDTTKLPEPKGGKRRHPLRDQPQIHHRNGPGATGYVKSVVRAGEHITIERLQNAK